MKTTSYSRNNIRWSLYLQCGSIQIWEGRPLSPSGGWVTYEVVESLSGKRKEVSSLHVMEAFNEMLQELNESNR